MSASAPLLDSATKLPALVQLPDEQITAEKRAFRRLAGARSASFVVGPAIIKRLKRAHGHLAAILAMFDESRPCVDLAQQLHAVENAVSNAKRELIHDHVEHCLDGPEVDTKAAMNELKQLAKYL
jgi:DNA-binding FrmR family transcriptional regulator